MAYTIRRGYGRRSRSASSVNELDRHNTRVYSARLAAADIVILFFSHVHEFRQPPLWRPIVNRQVNQNSHRTNPRRAKDATS